METIVRVKIIDATRVQIAGAIFTTVTEVAEVLQASRDADAASIVSIESDQTEHFQAIGTAVYAAHRVGFSSEQMRMVIAGKVVDTAW